MLLIIPFSIGPLQPDIGSVVTFPFASVRSKVPQNAKEVLVDFVVLFIESVNVLVIVVFGSHELHGSPPVMAAPTSTRSFEVQELEAGKVVVVCANAHEKNNSVAINKSSRLFKARSNSVCHLRVAVVGDKAQEAGLTC